VIEGSSIGLRDDALRAHPNSPSVSSVSSVPSVLNPEFVCPPRAMVYAITFALRNFLPRIFFESAPIQSSSTAA
jgi:hypothetical protein